MTTIQKTEAIELHTLATVFPEMDKQAFKDLVENIKKNGQLLPITLYQGKILDGRHRYLACLELGIDAKTTEYQGSDPRGYVLSLNEERRHMNESQRALTAAKFCNSQICDLAGIKPLSKNDAARALRVSPRSVDSARQVKQKGIPELYERVKNGDLAVSKAAELARLSHDEQRKLVHQSKKEINQAAKRSIQRKKVILPDTETIELKFTKAQMEIVHQAKKKINFRGMSDFLQELVIQGCERVLAPVNINDYKPLEKKETVSGKGFTF